MRPKVKSSFVQVDDPVFLLLEVSLHVHDHEHHGHQGKTSFNSVNKMDLINIDQYPLDKNNDKSYKDCVSDLRSKLVNKGVATCPGFLKCQAINEAVEDIDKVKSKAWKTDTSHNIYLDNGDSDYSAEHIRNKLLPTTVSYYLKARVYNWVRLLATFSHPLST